MIPRRFTDSLKDRVDLLRQSRTRLERGIRTELECPRPLALGPRSDPDTSPQSTTQNDGSRGHAPTRALDEQGVPRTCLGLSLDHPVGGEPRGGQARGIGERDLRRLVDQVPRGHAHDLGESPGINLAEQTAARVEGLVPSRSGFADDSVHNHLATIGRDSGGIGTEDHGGAIGRQCLAAQCPEVVMIQ